MDIKQAVGQILAADAGVSAIASTRIYASILPQSVTYPAVSFRQVDGDEVMNLGGADGLERRQFRAFAAATKAAGDYTVASRLAEAIRDGLSGYSGIVLGSDSPQTGIRVQWIEVISMSDLPFDDRSQTSQVAVDFEIWANHYTP